jgi:ABC-type glycerol-3-phosphate transport system permease component
MKKEFNYKINTVAVAIGSTFLTLFTSICSNFGKVYYSNNFGSGEISGTVLILIFLLLPIFDKGYRKYIWIKKGLITLFIALAINLPIAIYCTINKYNLFGKIL